MPYNLRNGASSNNCNNVVAEPKEAISNADDKDEFIFKKPDLASITIEQLMPQIITAKTIASPVAGGNLKAKAKTIDDTMPLQNTPPKMIANRPETQPLPSFVLFTWLNVVLLVLSVLVGSAFIIVSNVIVTFGHSKLWSYHFSLDMDMVFYCIVGFITQVQVAKKFVPLVLRGRLALIQSQWFLNF